jgi:putative DNA primase/helicase
MPNDTPIMVKPESGLVVDIEDYRPKQKPIVQIVGGALPEMVSAAEQHLITSDKEIFQRGDFVIRPAMQRIPIADDQKTSGMRLVPIRLNHMVERFTQAVEFQKYNARERKWLKTDCPKNVAATYLERVGLWKLADLLALTNCPTMRPDGSIIDRPGYDAETGILFSPLGLTFPPVPYKPTKEEGRAALDRIKALISEFPFVDGASRSVALSGILTAVVRRSLRSAPLHAFDAPVAGTGKSKLADLASMFAAGHEAPAITPGGNKEETEKRLGAMLLSGDPVISFDNCTEPLGGDALCSCLVQTIVKIRILGKSETPTIVCNAALFANGNNFSVFGDMVRRTLQARLDPQCERPELRTFTTEDPILVLRRERPRYVVDALTALRAFIVAGKLQQATPLGSFEAWSDLVRSALLWFGEPDPCDTMDRIRTGDPDLAELSSVLKAWHEVFSEQRVTVKAVIEKAYERKDGYDGTGTFCCPDLRESLLAIAGDNGVINGKRLGKWLLKQQDRVVEKKRIRRGREANAVWQVEIISQ